MTIEDKLKKILDSPIDWIQTFCRIPDKKGNIIPFILNPQQKHLIKNYGKYNIVLKSRQLGITTVSNALSLYYALNYENTCCLLMAHLGKTTKELFEKLKQIYYELPDAVKVPLEANNKEELRFANGSRIIVTTCGNGKRSVARGMTIRFCHLSEVAFMKDTVGKQILAIEQALASNGQIVLESTANGITEFTEMYYKAERKENLYKAFFFSFVDDKIMFADEYKEFSDMYIERYGSLPSENELDATEKFLVSKGATLQQIAWRRLKILNSSEEEFNQEFPYSPTVAFVSTGTGIFDAQHIQELLETVYEVSTLSSIPPGFPDALKPYFRHGLDVWRAPQKGKRYYVGVDTGEGIKQDNSAIEVFDDAGFQCAEYASNKIKPHSFASIVDEVGRYYNKALVVPEKASAGHIVVDRLKNVYKYRNLYRQKEYDARRNVKRTAGFTTTNKSKTTMIGDFQESFDLGEICINSKELLKEMKAFVSTDGSMGAIAGMHDDRVMAAGLAIHGIKHGINYAW